MTPILDIYYNDLCGNRVVDRDAFMAGAGAVVCFIRAHMKNGHSLKDSFSLMETDVHIFLNEED